MKRRTLYCFALSCCMAVLLEAQVSAPAIGIARYRDGIIRAISGVDSAFVVSANALGFADAASFSNYGGLVSNNGRIQLLDRTAAPIGEYDSGESRPVLGMDGDATSAIAWLPARHALLHWNGKSFTLVESNDGLEEVTSIRVQSATTAKLLISERGGAVSEALVSLETGNLISATLLPGVKAPAYQQNALIVFQDEDGLEVRYPNGAVHTLAIPAGEVRMERMSSEWLHLSSRATKQDWALHLTGGAPQLFELPQAAVRNTSTAKRGQEAAQ